MGVTAGDKPGYYTGGTEAERRRRENRGAEDADKCGDWGGGVPLHNRLGGLGKHRELPGAKPWPPTHFWHI